MIEHRVDTSFSATDRVTEILGRMGDKVLEVVRGYHMEHDATKTAEQIYCDCIYGYGENLE